MKFARIVFRVAGAYGIVALAPLYFMLDMIGRLDPPPVTHPQFYYGFVGIALAWQVAFFIIAQDPTRYRPMMIPSVIEKISYAGAILVLYQQGRLSPSAAATGVPDALFAVLFLVAFVKARQPQRGVQPIRT